MPAQSPPSAPRSALHLPRGNWSTVLECLCAHFPAISCEQWLDRIARGRVLDAQDNAIDAAYPYREGLRIFYFREVDNERPVPFTESMVYADQHLLVVDKPHFLAVTPAGQYVEETLLARLQRRFDNSQIVPLHRIDRLTAGLVLFSVNPETRSLYQALFQVQKFRAQNIVKRYEAIAPALPALNFPLQRATRLVAGEPFFRMQEIGGAPNSETWIEIGEACDKNFWRYFLYPRTGKKHQLRVHMAALGAPICNDPLYPTLREFSVDDYAQPLQLLARSLLFTDPLTGVERSFESQLELTFPIN